MTKESDGYVRALARGLAAVEALGRPPGRHTLAEVAVATELNRATARRVLATLVSLGYCELSGRYYSLRPRALGLGMSYLSTLPFWGHAQAVLEDLRNELGESCALAVLDGTEIVYILRAPARRILAGNLGIGSRLPAHLVSLGRVLLAGQTQASLDAYLTAADLTKRTDRTISDPETLRAELAKVAQSGFAWVDGELDPAICGLAVPVRDGKGRLLAAISVNTISGSLTEAVAKERFLVPLHRAAQEMRLRSPGGD